MCFLAFIARSGNAYFSIIAFVIISLFFSLFYVSNTKHQTYIKLILELTLIISDWINVEYRLFPLIESEYVNDY